MKRTQGGARRDPSRFYPALGLITILVLATVVYISYIANEGLPFENRYRVTVDVPNANRLTVTNEVRVAGTRVGQVSDIEAVRGSESQPPYSRVELELERELEPLPSDTRVTVSPASILGSTYVNLNLGQSADGIPDGGELQLEQAESTVELTDLLDVFDRATATGIQESMTSLGGGLAGRGAALNETFGELADLLPPLGQLSRALAAPESQLARLLTGYESFIRAFAPVSGDFAEAMANGSRTFDALDDAGPALDQVLDRAAPAFQATTAGLTRLQPSLDRLAGLFAELRDPVSRLPSGLAAGSSALGAGAPALSKLPEFTDDLGETTHELGLVSNDEASLGALRKLRGVAREALPSLRKIVPAQVQCNALSLFAQSFGTAYGAVGFAEGPPVAFIGEKHLGAIGESLQKARPSPGVAININPNENYDECESGNEPYPANPLPVFNNPTNPVRLGNPPGLQDNETLDTYPPEGVHSLAEKADLLPTLEDPP